MWDILSIEKSAEEKLCEQLGPIEGKAWFSKYSSAKKTMVEQLLPEIGKEVAGLSDHGPVHIKNVLENAGHLLKLSDSNGPTELSGVDFYFLITSILFHDVGNIYGRKAHNQKVSSIYDKMYAAAELDLQEKKIVVKAAAAHTGPGNDGTKDTLKDLAKTDSFRGKRVNLRDIATILRFADELAEGPQRTSRFILRDGPLWKEFPDPSKIYHEYASITEVHIDPNGDRIALTYNFAPDFCSDEKKLRELLDFTYKRIVKLNQERKYARYYTDLLLPFRKTTVAFNFWVNGMPSSLGLETPFEIQDITIPDSEEKVFTTYNTNFEPDSIVAKIKALTKEATDGV